MKNPFKVGDRVRIKSGTLKGKVGRVVFDHGTEFIIPLDVELEYDFHITPYSSSELEPLETPIERMRRRYNEEQGSI